MEVAQCIIEEGVRVGVMHVLAVKFANGDSARSDFIYCEKCAEARIHEFEQNGAVSIVWLKPTDNSVWCGIAEHKGY